MQVPATAFFSACISAGLSPTASRSLGEEEHSAARNPAAFEQATPTLIITETKQNNTEATKLWQHLTYFPTGFPNHVWWNKMEIPTIRRRWRWPWEAGEKRNKSWWVILGDCLVASRPAAPSHLVSALRERAGRSVGANRISRHPGIRFLPAGFFPCAGPSAKTSTTGINPTTETTSPH